MNAATAGTTHALVWLTSPECDAQHVEFALGCHGEFVRRWVPEFGSATYPAPIVDDRAAVKHAKDKMYALRATPEARARAEAVQQQHGSSKSGLPPSGMQRRSAKARAPDPADQLSLFSE